VETKLGAAERKKIMFKSERRGFISEGEHGEKMQTMNETHASNKIFNY
jgi:hypothetical protein